jgi:hypothetical protein
VLRYQNLKTFFINKATVSRSQDYSKLQLTLASTRSCGGEDGCIPAGAWFAWPAVYLVATNRGVDANAMSDNDGSGI